MGVRRAEDLVAWQLASAFKLEAYRPIRCSSRPVPISASETNLLQQRPVWA
jgi:hypothetical protein